MVYLHLSFCLQVITLASSTGSVPNTRGEINGFLRKRLAMACDCSGHIVGGSANPRTLKPKLAMSPTSTIHSSQYDIKYVTFHSYCMRDSWLTKFEVICMNHLVIIYTPHPSTCRYLRNHHPHQCVPHPRCTYTHDEGILTMSSCIYPHTPYATTIPTHVPASVLPTSAPIIPASGYLKRSSTHSCSHSCSNPLTHALFQYYGPLPPTPLQLTPPSAITRPRRYRGV